MAKKLFVVKLIQNSHKLSLVNEQLGVKTWHGHTRTVRVTN
jgi:hypothetical protein